MTRLPLGMMILIVVSILIYFGIAHRMLDRMRLTDKGALGIIAALIIGSFIDIPISSGEVQVSINVGGALIPIGLAIYLLVKAGTTKEWGRALFAAAATGATIYVVGSLVMTGDPSSRLDIVDPLYVYPLVAGGLAYILGRSRRAAFIAATLGVLSLDVVHFFWLLSTATPGTVSLGGAGAFDSIVVAGLVAILLAEVIGETRERLQGGPVTRGRDPELIKGLRSIDTHKEDPQEKQREYKSKEGEDES